MIGQAREAKCGQTRQDRTNHFLQPPLVKLPIFTPVALELLCLSLWATSWWHSGQQTQQANRRKPGARQERGGVGEQIKHEATEKRLIKSRTLCSGLFSLVRGWPVDTPLLSSRDHVDIHLVYVHPPLFTQVKHGRSWVERCCLVGAWWCTWPSLDPPLSLTGNRLRFSSASRAALRFPSGPVHYWGITGSKNLALL